MEHVDLSTENKVSSLKTRNWFTPLLFSIGIVLFFIISFLLYRTYFGSLDINSLGSAVDLQDTVVNLVLDEEYSLDDYESILWAPNTIKFNTCEDEMEIVQNGYPWTRDWLYLALFNSLSSDIGVDLEEFSIELADTETLLDSLYEQFTFSEEEPLAILELWGQDPYCIPILVLNDLVEHGDDFQTYEGTLNLAENLCYDFYDLAELDNLCGEDDICLTDEEFYSGLEDLLFVAPGESLDVEEELSKISYYPVQTIVDDYIVGYEKNSVNYVALTNTNLFNAIRRKDLYHKYYESIASFDGPNYCKNNREEYSNILKAMLAKRSYLSDEELIHRHEHIENRLISMCGNVYSDMFDFLSSEYYIGEKLELYYLLRNSSVESIQRREMRNLVRQELEASLFYKEYKGESYALWGGSLLELDAKTCQDVEIDISKNLKDSFYLLVYSNYEY